MTKEEAFNYLEGCVAAHEGGTNVAISFDDATFDYFVKVGRTPTHRDLTDRRKYGYGKSLISAIEHLKKEMGE